MSAGDKTENEDSIFDSVFSPSKFTLTSRGCSFHDDPHRTAVKVEESQVGQYLYFCTSKASTFVPAKHEALTVAEGAQEVNICTCFSSTKVLALQVQEDKY